MTLFFGRKIRFFGSNAVWVLVVVFFLAPFAMRGARMSLQRMKNDVKDWLPSDFPETQELEWFGDHFVGERFILITWPGCTQQDDRYRLLLQKLQGEVVAEESSSTEKLTPEQAELLSARKIGDRLGISIIAKVDSQGRYVDEFHQNWGNRQEKWLKGDHDLWYFITPQGELYRWNGRSNVLGAVQRSFQRGILGKKTAEGELIAQFGKEPTADQPNAYFADPRKITARLFKTVTTGPALLEELSLKGGPLWPMGESDKETAAAIAKKKALERLTGTLFAPAPNARKSGRSRKCFQQAANLFDCYT